MPITVGTLIKLCAASDVDPDKVTLHIFDVDCYDVRTDLAELEPLAHINYIDLVKDGRGSDA